MAGEYQKSMSNADYWDEEALCAGMDYEKFFDKYEDDPELAKQIDNLCLACPVMLECFRRGVSSESWGVWGGIYLVDGKPDKTKNSHKTKQIWNRIYEVVNDVH